MRSLPWRVFAIFAALIAAGCSGGRVGDLEAEVGRVRNDVRDIRALQAEQSALIDEIKTQVSALGGKFDEFQYSAKGRTEAIEQQLRTVSQRVPPPPGVPEDLLNGDDEAISRISGPAADLFRSGLVSLRNGRYDEAVTSFSRFVQENPGTAFTDNALFWLGICAEKQEQLNQAVVAYSDVFRRFPAEDRVPPALYRLAEVFLKMGSKGEATVALQKLVEEHPGSDWADRGRGVLNSLVKPRGGAAGKKR